MSYDRPYRGGGQRRRYRDDYDDRRRETYESPAEKFKATIIKFGDVDALEELPRLEKFIRDATNHPVSVVAASLRIGVTEQPFKIPYYALLLRKLHDFGEEESPEGQSKGQQILEDFWKGFQSYLDQHSWRETRLCIQFFAHLTLAKLISTESMLALLQSFTAVLDEFGVSHGRAKQAAVCAAEGLMIGGPILKAESPRQVQEIISAIHAYNDTTTTAKWLVGPVNQMHTLSTSVPHADELLDIVLQALRAFDESDFSETASAFMQPYSTCEDLDRDKFTPYSLPSVLVPPEVIELEGLSTDSGESGHIKKEEWPEYYLSLFDSEVTPDPKTPAGYAVRSLIADIVQIFEVNRKDCARLLLEFPKWVLPGTFKPKPSPVEADAAPAPVPVPGKDWQLESTIVEIILGMFLLLPDSQHKSVYYMALITELCKLSPSTGGPAVGKSFRKLYSQLGDGLDLEISRRFAEWFSVHMSNFNFGWVWKEWIPDLSLSVYHPKRAFMQRAVELEIRLSYHDRILQTLPVEMRTPDSQVISENAPGPDFEYEDPAKTHHDAAQTILNLLRGRAKAEDVIARVETLKASLEASEDGDMFHSDALVRSITVQSLLHVGSRSFSHLLNAIERYLPLLRSIASGGASTAVGSGVADAKADILSIATTFWKNNRQLVIIVFDKLMQYQIVDPTDVVEWAFVRRAELPELNSATGTNSLRTFEWEIVRAALDKANGRVSAARRKVAALRKEDDEVRARALADGAMDVDADVKPETTADSPALSAALKALASLTREQKAALSKTLEGFVSYLTPAVSEAQRRVITEQGWNERARWEKEEWNTWETWSWYRHFCRSYAPYLRTYSTTLQTVSFSKFEGSTDPGVELLKKTWNIATGQE
uniref:Cap binding protein 80-PB n=1 Tax=Mycena chlorophos TaxID=658473 RepID=A0ABQ0L4S4_MYCCL|nr:predicted protein [Mycena chlorophos]